MKEELIELIKQKVSEKIQKLELLIAETRASNNETKSSMGDKYETSREMLQQQINGLQVQLNQQLKDRQLLLSIPIQKHKVIGMGSFVSTDKGKFFIAISLGELFYNDEKIFVISKESPLAQLMLGKRKGEMFEINNLIQIIKEIS